MTNVYYIDSDTQPTAYIDEAAIAQAIQDLILDEHNRLVIVVQPKPSLSESAVIPLDLLKIGA